MKTAIQPKPGDADSRRAETSCHLVIFMGLPASGKSTFFRTRFADTHCQISKDLMRNVRNRELRQRERIATALGQGHSVVVDNINATVGDRAPLIALGRAHHGRIIGYHFDSSVRECIARNATRVSRQRVPNVAVYAAARRFQMPTRSEGFDCLYQVRLVGQSDYEITELPL